MGSPSNTDRALSVELAQLRHQVLELHQALANAGQDHVLAQAWPIGSAQVGTWEWEVSTNRVLLSLETERIFGLPGLGLLTLDAFAQYDLPVLMGGVIVGATVLVVMNLVVDILYTVLDPRVRLG